MPLPEFAEIVEARQRIGEGVLVDSLPDCGRRRRTNKTDPHDLASWVKQIVSYKARLYKHAPYQARVQPPA